MNEIEILKKRITDLEEDSAAGLVYFRQEMARLRKAIAQQEEWKGRGGCGGGKCSFCGGTEIALHKQHHGHTDDCVWVESTKLRS